MLWNQTIGTAALGTNSWRIFQGNVHVTEIIPRYSTGAIYVRAMHNSAHSKAAVLVSQSDKILSENRVWMEWMILVLKSGPQACRTDTTQLHPHHWLSYCQEHPILYHAEKLFSVEFYGRSTEFEISDISDCETGQKISVRELHNFTVKGNSATFNCCYNCIRLLSATVPRAGKEGNRQEQQVFLFYRKFQTCAED